MFWSAKRNVNQVYLSTKRNAQNLIFSSRPCCQPADLQPNLPLAFRMQTSDFFLQDFITFFTPIQLQSKANFQLQFLCRIQKQSSREIVVSLHFSICIRDDDDWSVISCFNPIFGEKLPKSKGWWTNFKIYLNFNLALAFEVPLPLLGGWKGLSSTKCET